VCGGALCGWAGAVGEGAGFGASLWVGLATQAGQVGEQELGEVVGESVADHDAEHREVGAVFGEGVGGHQPAVFAQRGGDVEDGVAADVLGRVKAKTGSSSPRVSSRNGPSSLILSAKVVATSPSVPERTL
jgi:hypothetical protein